MAVITLETPASASVAVPASTISFSVTIGTNTNRLVIIGVSNDTSQTVRSVTLGGKACTSIRTDAVGTIRSSLYYYLGDAVSGTVTVLVTFNGNCDSVAGAIPIYGVDQTNPIVSHNGATATSNSPSVTVTSSEDSWVFDNLAHLSTGISGSSSVHNQDWGIQPLVLFGGAGGDKPDAGTGSTTLGWGLNTSVQWAQSAVSIAPNYGNQVKMGGVGI